MFQFEVCKDFLNSGCKAEAKTCDKLHICRFFDGVCPITNCHRAHDFSRGINRRIICTHRCQHIDSKVLVKFLRCMNVLAVRMFFCFSSIKCLFFVYHQNPTQGYGRGSRGGRGRGRQRNRRGRGGGGHGHAANHFTQRPINQEKNDPSRQVDVSFPSLRLAPQIDMEIVDMILKTRNIEVDDKFNENDNEYFRRGTFQLQRINGRIFLFECSEKEISGFFHFRCGETTSLANN